MATKIENTAAGNVISRLASPYSPDNLLMYHTSLSLVERMVQNGLLTQIDYRKSVAILTKKYGLPSNSIFAETA